MKHNYNDFMVRHLELQGTSFGAFFQVFKHKSINYMPIFNEKKIHRLIVEAHHNCFVKSYLLFFVRQYLFVAVFVNEISVV